MPYDKYIRTEAWHTKGKLRYEFDGGKCVVCQKQFSRDNTEPHHITYVRLGHEEMEDIITLCLQHHRTFHSNWKPAEYFKETNEDHWKDFSLEDTAKLCAMYLHEDYWFGGALNCCNVSVCTELIDSYFRDCEIIVPPIIDPHDVEIYFRNKRYEVLFEAEKNGVDLNEMTDAGEAFLDEKFGKKGGKGGNPMRAQARSFMTKHNSESFHRNYWCTWQHNILMQEAKKYEQA